MFFLRIVLITGFLSGCIGVGGHSQGQQSAQDQNRFECSSYTANIPRPNQICGEEGYDYLHQTYLRRTCGGCHYSGSFIHPNAMGDRDLTTAFNAGRALSKEAFLNTVLNGSLISPDCQLDPQMELYQDLEEWLDNRFCPQ